MDHCWVNYIVASRRDRTLEWWFRLCGIIPKCPYFMLVNVIYYHLPRNLPMWTHWKIHFCLQNQQEIWNLIGFYLRFLTFQMGKWWATIGFWGILNFGQNHLVLRKHCLLVAHIQRVSFSMKPILDGFELDPEIPSLFLGEIHRKSMVLTPIYICLINLYVICNIYNII